MDEWTELLVYAWEYMLSLNTTSFWIQIGSLAVFAVLAKLINRYWTYKFMQDGDQVVLQNNGLKFSKQERQLWTR